MRITDYSQIAKKIDPLLSVYFEDDFVYFLYPMPPKNGNILLQETEHKIVLWSNEYKEKSFQEVLNLLYEAFNTDIIVPFIETEEEYNAVMSLGGTSIEFVAPDCEDLCRDYGSFIIRKQMNDGI